MRFAFSLIVLLVSIIAGITPLTAAGVTFTPIGTPTWEPVDFHVFSAPIGTEGSGYAEFLATLAALLPPPNHISDPAVGILPGTSHAPPYNQELANGVSNLGYAEKTAFTASGFSNGMGVYLAYMIVPRAGGTTGSSQDDPTGPIISNSLQPLHSVYSTFQNSTLFKEIEMYDTIVNAGFDGYSHIPNFVANNFDFASNPSAGILGSYEYRITLTDTTGNGWMISAPFQVVPEPGTIVFLGFGLAGLAGYAWTRRN